MQQDSEIYIVNYHALCTQAANKANAFIPRVSEHGVCLSAGGIHLVPHLLPVQPSPSPDVTPPLLPLFYYLSVVVVDSVFED